MAPIPKPAAQRRNRRPVPPTDYVPAGAVTVPDCPEDLHPLALKMFEALKVSGQSRFYEQSDWAFALVTCERMSRLLQDGSTSGSAWSAVDSALSRLLATEGDRRRLRLELVREDIAVAQQQRRAERRLKAVDGVAGA